MGMPGIGVRCFMNISIRLRSPISLTVGIAFNLISAHAD